MKLKEKLEKKQAAIRRMRESHDSIGEQLLEMNERCGKVRFNKLRDLHMMFRHINYWFILQATSLHVKVKDEMQDLSDEHSSLKDTLLATIKDISREIKYSDFIIDEYIPSK